jgi:hypothetical protein
MSDSFLRFIPSDPNFVPPRVARKAVLAKLQTVYAKADGVEARESESVAFVDAGSNFERTLCPLCEAEIEQDWWEAAIGRAAENEFTNLRVDTPCCDRTTSLNELRYEMPQGFSRMVWEVMNPRVRKVPPALLKELRGILGCDLRVIFAHY